MKFNEKLIELRKKEGLSQEELGYKLNVTRQTVSKWELGQTTPEMDKLAEMSKIFNISVDNLINESEAISESENNEINNIEDQPIKDQTINKESSKEKNVKIIIMIALIAVIVMILIKFFTSISVLNKVKDNEATGESFISRIFDFFDQILDMTKDVRNDIANETQNIIKDTQNNIINEAETKINIERFNSQISIFNGTKKGDKIKELLNNVITSNKTQDKKITVKYNETETQDENEIKNLKTNINSNNNYEVSFEYDEEGYINKVIIEKTFTQYEIQSFNGSLEMRAGTQMGSTVTYVLDSIITINKTKEHKITVKYNATETQDENEIKNIKKNFDRFTYYELSFEYDTDGFINQAIIEN